MINVWYGSQQTFGANGQPQQWVNVLGDVSDPSGMASLTYTLNGGPANTLSMGENQVRLVEPGEFNVEIDYASLAGRCEHGAPAPRSTIWAMRRPRT